MTEVPQAGRIKAIWLKLWGFLKRDVRSFFGFQSSLTPSANSEYVLADQLEPLPSRVDPQKLDRIRFRRALLDWRDEFCVQFSNSASDLSGRFESQIEDELQEVGLFRKVLPKPAGELLEEKFNSQVRFRLLARARQAEKDLSLLLSKWSLQVPPALFFRDQWPNARFVATFGEVGFKPANRNEILEILESLILGEQGILPTYLAQATSMTRNLIEGSAS